MICRCSPEQEKQGKEMFHRVVRLNFLKHVNVVYVLSFDEGVLLSRLFGRAP